MPGADPKLERRILRLVRRAVAEFQLIAAGDRILVALSGGKDSWTLLWALEALRRAAPVGFSLIAVNLDHGFPGTDTSALEACLRAGGTEYRLVSRDVAGLLAQKLGKGETRCALCSRIRRGVLYDLAPAIGCNKIALGHHKDDLIETLLLNLLFEGQLKAMPAWLRSDDGRNVVIRPLLYVAEAECAALSRARGYPIVPCTCPGESGRDLPQRRFVKERLAALDRRFPGLKSSLLTALANVVPSHLLDRAIAGGPPGRAP